MSGNDALSPWSAAMAAVIADYEAMWAERDPARRAALIAASLVEEATIVGPGYLLRGHRAITEEAARFQRTEPGHCARRASGIDMHGNLARFAVKIENAAGALLADGLDVVEFAADGRIARVITFWGAMPAAGIRFTGPEERAARVAASEGGPVNAPGERAPTVRDGGADTQPAAPAHRAAATMIMIEVCDEVPTEAAGRVDTGLGDANAAFAPVADVRRLACFARAGGMVIGGAVGRTWGECCELQQLWVDAARRGAGIGTQLMRAFEARAAARGCRTFYLDTFSFQAPAFYRTLGYTTVLAIEGYAPGVVRYTMMRRN